MSKPTAFAHVDAERTILGAVLIDSTAWITVSELVRARDYADARHRAIHDALESVAEQGRGVDVLTVREALISAGTLDAAGGLVYVASLADGMPRVTNIGDWCAIVVERSRRRKAHAIGARLQALAADDAEKIETTLDSATSALSAMLDADGSRVDVSMREATKGAVARLERSSQRAGGVTGIPTSIPWLDRLCGGWQPGQLIVIAARPACGKSVFCSQNAVVAARAGFKVRAATLEMPPESVAERILLGEARADRYTLARDESAWARIARWMGEVSDLTITFDARESPTVAQLRASARRQRETRGLDVLFVDYLQRVAFDERLDERIGVGRVTRALKSLALALKIPVVCAAQLNRTAEHKEPSLAELAESGTIEREADIVVALHPDPESKGKGADDLTTHMLVLKHREGACGRRRLVFEKKLARFVDEAERVEEW